MACCGDQDASDPVAAVAARVSAPKFGYPPDLHWSGLEGKEPTVLAGCGDDFYVHGHCKWNPNTNLPKMPNMESFNTSMANAFAQDPQLWDDLAKVKTEKSGVKLAQCIKVGMDIPKPEFKRPGVIAVDEECYETFGDLFDAVIGDFQDIDLEKAKHKSDWNVGSLTASTLDCAKPMLKSVRMRVARNLAGFSFPAGLSFDERREVEAEVMKALEPLGGTYMGLKGSESTGQAMDHDFQNLLKDKSASLHTPHPKDIAAFCNGYCRHWPDARGVWANKSQDVFIHVNEEDHFRIFSISNDADVRSLLERVGAVVQGIKAEFAKNSLGYLTSCPSSTGTGMCITAKMELKHFPTHEKFDVTLAAMGCRVIYAGSCYTIANSMCYGLSEIEVSNNLIHAVTKVAEFEKAMAAGQDIEAEVGKVIEHKEGDNCVIS